MVNEVQQLSVDVCIATYKRPNLLKKLLASLVQQTTIAAIKFRIIIIDNDSEKSAESIVHSFFADKKITYIYDVQPQKNIALTRNKALEYASADYVAFIDDDEWAANNWLATLLATINQYGADVVFGVVVPQFPEKAPKWVLNGIFFKPAEIKTGEVRPYGASNNTLVKNSTKVKKFLRFDPEYGLTGGEDTELFSRLSLNGFKLISCKDAIVYEAVANDRMTVNWLVKRSLRGGQVYAKIFYTNQPLLKMIGFILQRVAYLFAAVIAFLVSLPLGKAHWVRALCKVATNVGQLSMLFTKKPYQEYK